MSDLPELNAEVAKLMFIPVVERIIESRASNLRYSLREHLKSKSGKGASLGLRLPGLFEKLPTNPVFADQFMVL